MRINVYRAPQHSDAVNSGWAEYSYSFEPEDKHTSHGIGGGAYGKCEREPSDTVLVYDVPDGSHTSRSKGGDGMLFVPGSEGGLRPHEIAAVGTLVSETPHETTGGAMSETQHTPTPFQQSSMSHIEDANGDVIVHVFNTSGETLLTEEQYQERRAFIVRACNAHDGLVAERDELRAIFATIAAEVVKLRQYVSGAAIPDYYEIACSLTELESAIAKDGAT